MVGRTLGHYRLLELVGQGGMAAVYRARDLSLDRDCAVKILHRHLQCERESRLRFQREAQAVARLRHPNILEIYAYSVDEADESFLVTEFIAGPTLRAQMLSHPPRFPEIGAMIGCEVARAREHHDPRRGQRRPGGAWRCHDRAV
jgi:eukaryotic-like serine/threonine-protein kinase